MRQQLFYNLHTRLTTVVLAVVMAPIAVMLVLVALQAQSGMRDGASERLNSVGQGVADSVSNLLEMNERALSQLVSLPGIVSMDSQTQKPILETTTGAYPYLELVSTVDLNGLNVARSESASLADYSNWAWFQSAAAGQTSSYQVVTSGGDSGQPVVIASMPIRDAGGTISGVAMYASKLDPFIKVVNASRFHETGFAYLVDETGLALAHPDHPSAQLLGVESEQPVVNLLSGVPGKPTFVDAAGAKWQYTTQTLDNGWAVVAQQESAEINAELAFLQRFTLLGALVTLTVVLILVFLTTRLLLRPVQTLTEAAFAIADGDFDRTIPVRRKDELGILANAFNTMTSYVKSLIADLEQRVAERTEELFHQAQELEASNRLNQRRAAQLEASAQVTRSVASILEPERLLNEVVHMISDHFGHYHVGLFLLDETNTWAILRAANSEGGQQMLAQDHRLQVAEKSIVGYAAYRGRPRLAIDMGADAIHFDNPHLPETRSEIALPLIAHDQTLGALDVQSKKSDAFDEQEIAVLSALAGQVALALDNARLFAATQEALRQMERGQQQAMSQAWSKHMVSSGRQGLYTYAQKESETVVEPAETQTVLSEGTTQVTSGGNGQDAAVVAPIIVRDQVIGALGLQEKDRTWSREQIELVETVADQVGQALEAARLFEESQRRAHRESLIGEISAKIRGADDIDGILRITIQEARRALGVTHGAIRVGTETHLRPPADQKGENR